MIESIQIIMHLYGIYLQDLYAFIGFIGPDD